ncbi:hypothetical protein RchiOBHm_Chr5g0056491 [Rosa chinensis]|uniref:Uncharacterized protein n=1 Tax=Rosa chinensis TaxID=74649 RepID=A0A2P6QGP7_ROSCH|nr:hypothetical protein RchiOBHm_Chr5g0056491 [Rosa chinensis]
MRKILGYTLTLLNLVSSTQQIVYKGFLTVFRGDCKPENSFNSSLGQSLKTSTYVWEIYYAVFISVSGLVLFSSLIGNMQVGAEYK